MMSSTAEILTWARRTAQLQPCYLPEETARPCFRWWPWPNWSLILTLGCGAPLDRREWHASVAYHPGFPPVLLPLAKWNRRLRSIARRRLQLALAPLGEGELEFRPEQNSLGAFRAARAGEVLLCPLRDIRGTAEERERLDRVASEVDPRVRLALGI